MNVGSIHFGIPTSGLERIPPAPFDPVKGDDILSAGLRYFHCHLLWFADSSSTVASSILEENSRPYFHHREEGRMLKMNRKKNAVAGNNDQTGTVPRYTYAGSAAPNRVTGIRIKEYRVSFVVSLRDFSSFVPSCDGDNFALFLLRRGAHHRVLHDSIYKTFPAKDRLGLTTFVDPLKGKDSKKCLEHSVGPGAVSCSFQLQESGLLDEPVNPCNLPEECREIVYGYAREIANIAAGGVKANNQARQRMGLEEFPPDGLFFGTCALNSSRGVKKLEYEAKDREWGA